MKVRTWSSLTYWPNRTKIKSMKRYFFSRKHSIFFFMYSTLDLFLANLPFQKSGKICVGACAWNKKSSTPSSRCEGRKPGSQDLLFHFIDPSTDRFEKKQTDLEFAKVSSGALTIMAPKSALKEGPTIFFFLRYRSINQSIDRFEKNRFGTRPSFVQSCHSHHPKIRGGHHRPLHLRCDSEERNTYFSKH